MNKIIDSLKKIKTLDIVILVFVLIAFVVGFLTFKGYRQTASKQIEATSQIVFKVYMRGVTLSGDKIPIVKGNKTFISIRNVPYSDLDILDVNAQRRKIVVASGSKKLVIAVEDESQPDLYDLVVTLTDNAKITKDGAVVGGNKIKIGLPITLEGKNYRFTGTVSDIKVTDAANNEEMNNITTTDDVQ